MADLATRVVAEVRDDFLPWLVGGLPSLALILVASVGGVILVYGGMALGAAPGALSGDEDLAVVGMMVGVLLGVMALVLAMILVATPLQVGTWRAVWRHVAHGERLTVGAVLGSMFQDLPRVFLLNVVTGALITGGLLLCYVPGLALSAALIFAYPAVVIHGLPVGRSISWSLRHTLDHLSWHLGLFGLLLVMSLVLPYIPVLGYALLATLGPLLVLRAYHAAFGADGPRL